MISQHLAWVSRELLWERMSGTSGPEQLGCKMALRWHDSAVSRRDYVGIYRLMYGERTVVTID